MLHQPLRFPSSSLVHLLALVLAPALGPLLSACGGGGEPTGVDGDGDTGPVATVEVAPVADTLTALGATRELQATARDPDGAPISGVTFAWSSADASVATVDDQGIATAVGEGESRITATADGVSGSAQVAVIQLVETVSISPSSATLTTVGTSQQFGATATDANGNEVAGATFVWSSEDHTVATVDPSGLATAKGDGTSTITATAQDVPGHADLAVNQEIDHLAFRTDPTGAVAGDAIDPAVQVEVLDGSGNRVEDAEIAITLAIGTNPSGGALGGSKTVNATAGVATFGGIWIDRAAAGYTLAASTPGSVTGAESAAFDISPAPADRLAFATEPTDAAAGAAIGPAVDVEVLDEFGNRVTSSSASVSLTLGANPGEATLQGTTTVGASSGVATFDDLSLEVAAAGYTLVASGSGLGNETSASFQITPAAASQLAFTGQPSDVEGQEPMAAPVEVEVRDAFGNLVTSSTADVTVAIGEDPTGGEATLSGTKTVSASSGVATFGGLSVARPGDGFTLEATATGLAAGESDAFAVRLTFVQTSAGSGHSCGVTAAGHAYCWGSNSFGELGDGTTTTASTPVPVAGGHAFGRVSAGSSHSCGVTTADEAYCWGLNTSGRLGDGTTTNRSSPVAVDVSGLSTQAFATVSAGGFHTCGLTTANEPYCWGRNTNGQLGNQSTTDALTPAAVDVSGLSTQTFAVVSAGHDHTCGVTTADEAFCWGDNASGQIGDGSTTDRTVPTAVDATGISPPNFTDVAAGGDHTCAVTTFDKAFCWGGNGFGQLGDGSSTDSPTPVAVSTSEAFLDVSAATHHTCGLTTADGVRCWGDNASGQLGDGSATSSSSAPVAVAAFDRFGLVSAGGLHTCGVTADDVTLCWGSNFAGQVGDGTTEDRAIPVRVVQ